VLAGQRIKKYTISIKQKKHLTKIHHCFIEKTLKTMVKEGKFLSLVTGISENLNMNMLYVERLYC
jgi:hypothetical protein